VYGGRDFTTAATGLIEERGKGEVGERGYVGYAPPEGRELGSEVLFVLNVPGKKET